MNTPKLLGNITGRLLHPGGAEVNTTYTFDSRDRLTRIAVDSPPSTQRFGYDAGRIRKSKRAADGTKTKFHYGGLAVADERRTSTPASTAFFSGHQLLGFDRSGNFFYFLADGLASVRLVVNSSGVEAARYNSSESGNPIEATESGTSSSQTWVGALGVRDETAESGLHYMRHRYYDSGSGGS